MTFAVRRRVAALLMLATLSAVSFADCGGPTDKPGIPSPRRL